MKLLYLMFLGLFLIGCNQTDNESNNNETNELADVSELRKEFVDAWNNKDSAAIVNLFTGNSMVMNDTLIMMGSQNIASKWVSGGVKVLSDLEVSSSKTNVSNTLAYDAGIYTVNVNLPNQKLKERGNYTLIWEKINDEWKVASAHIEDVTQMPDVGTTNK